MPIPPPTRKPKPDTHPAAAHKAARPVAPPAYRPQPPPRVLQRKAAPTAPTPAATMKPAPAAPPVYRPQPAPKVLQTKQATNQTPPAASSRVRPTAPPAYRLQPTPKVLQRKVSAPARPTPAEAPRAHAAPNSRAPRPSTNALQAKASKPMAATPRGVPAARPAHATPRTLQPNAAHVKNARRPAAPKVVQRYVAWREHNTVYMPEGTETGGEYENSLRVLLPGYAILKPSWVDFAKKVWPDKMVDGKLMQNYFTDLEKRAVNRLYKQFLNDKAVFMYDTKSIRQASGSNTRLLLTPHDMSERVTTNLNTTPGELDACVVESLADLGVPLNNTTYDREGWHRHCRDDWTDDLTQQKKALDYRQDNQYIKLYVGKLGFRLVNNEPTRWDEIDWRTLGGQNYDGQYFATTYKGVVAGVGHMVGVVVEGGQVTQVHDKQNLTRKYVMNTNEGLYDPHDVFATYIFKR